MTRIRELREESGLKLKELSKIIGVSESTMSLYENGKHEPDYTTLIKIADYFKVSLDYLLCRETVFQYSSSFTIDEEEMMQLFRKAGQKYGRETQQSLINLVKNVLNIKQ